MVFYKNSFRTKATPILYKILIVVCLVSCAQKKDDQMEKQKQIQEQLGKLNSLLRDSTFAIAFAKGQDSAYYSSQKQDIPAFEDDNQKIKKSFKEEKIAINLAGFYAVECGIGVLITHKDGTPLQWLQKIVNKKTDSGEVLLLNRFANATWKTGQPFRNLSRIKRDNFIVANYLSEAETKKDYDQVIAAASKLLDSLKAYQSSSKEEQFKEISRFMKDKKYALEMAQYMEAAYYTAENKPVPPFVSPAEDTVTIEKNAFDEKVATNLAAFYALECGLSYLAASNNELPSDVLLSIINGSIAEKDKQLLERFANATWKAGQPFRNLDRISKDNFTPFYFLSAEEIEKDWVQIKTAAIMLKKIL